MTLRVSVALATHEGAGYVAEQVASILAQRRPVDELVLSDDASTDDTVGIVERLFAAHDSPPDLVVLRNDPPLGVTANFAQALAAATGDLIVLSDQDDVWRPDRVGTALDRFAAHEDTLLVHGDADLVDGAGAPLGRSLFASLEIGAHDVAEIRAGRALPLLLKRNLVTGATAAVRRELVELARPFPSSWVHDEWLAILAAIHGRTDVVPHALVAYRQHGANQIGVGAPTLRHKVSRVLAPRADRNALLARRAADLLAHLEAAERPVDESVLEAVRGKIAHERFRAGLPTRRLARIPHVLGELRRGGYDRFSSRGRADVVRDLLQPSERRGSE